jgi:hypothetical protein
MDYQLLYMQKALNDLAEILRRIAARIVVSQSAS